MRRTFPVLLLYACLIGTPKATAQNLRYSFPHFAVGDQYVSVIDLTNKGTSTFSGAMGFANDTGQYLPVYVDGTYTTGNYPISIPAGATRRYRVSNRGGTTSGHVVIWDSKGSVVGSYDDRISGTLTFEFMNGSSLVDATGIGSPAPMEHFYFIAEYAPATELYTGLAVADPVGTGATLQLKAYSEVGSFVDGRTLVIAKYGHRAFFVNQILSLPAGFRGTIEVVSDKTIEATVLKSQRNQLSAVDVNPFPVNYDVTISLSNGKQYQAEMSISIAGGLSKGLFRFKNVTCDSPFEQSPVSGLALEGFCLVHVITSLAGRATLVTLSSTSLRTSVDSIGGTVIWTDDYDQVGGTFSGWKRK